MVGCVAGEAHLHDGNDVARTANAQLLAEVIAKHRAHSEYGLLS